MYQVFLLSVEDPDNQLLLKAFAEKEKALMYYSAVAKFALKIGCIISIKQEA